MGTFTGWSPFLIAALEDREKPYQRRDEQDDTGGGDYEHRVKNGRVGGYVVDSGVRQEEYGVLGERPGPEKGGDSQSRKPEPQRTVDTLKQVPDALKGQ